ncbi:hypothetical protein MAQ58_23660, partial [Enterobacter sp. DRP3]|nr:hypothetical protein [Enterobacter sp. DRP3]
SLPAARHYDFVRDQLARCRAHGADSAASLLIYCELALRYGARFDEDPAMAAVFDAMMRATAYMDHRRIPELYCGFRRRQGRGPTLYPVECAQQAWAAAAPFHML